MDKHIRNHITAWIVFVVLAVAYLILGPENQDWRLGLTVALVAAIPFVLVTSWKSAPARQARREAAIAAAASE